MKSVENLEISLSITIELAVVNIQRCSIIVPHKEGEEEESLPGKSGFSLLPCGINL